MNKEQRLSSASIVAHQSWLVGQGKSSNTVRSYSADLRTFLEWCKLDVPSDQLQSRAQEWLNATRQEAAPKTTQRRITSLKSFWTFLRRSDPTLTTTFLTDYRAPTASRTIPHPVPGGLDSLYQMIEVATSLEMRCLLSLTGLSGLRISEALAVEPRHFDMHNLTLTVRGKGDKTRVIPVSTEAMTFILPRIAEVQAGPLVRLTDRGARYAISRLAERAGLARHVSSHDLRATFATDVYSKTLNIRVVQELLGHASSQTTEIYTGVTDRALRDAVEA